MTQRYLLCLALLFTTSLLLKAQQHTPHLPPGGHAPVRFAPASAEPQCRPPLLQGSQRTTPAAQVQQPQRAERATSLMGITLGGASNLYTWLRPEQNLLQCDNATGLLTHIHRQDISLWGGGTAANGLLRYDISLDRGASFSNDLGPLNDSLYLFGARYPQVVGRNPGAVTSAADMHLLWVGATINSSTTWNGIVYGTCTDLVPDPVTSEEYEDLGTGNLITGSLCAGLPNEYWMVDMDLDGTSTVLFPRLVKGTYTGSTLTWAVHDTLSAIYNVGITGDIPGTTTQVAFSPDGMDGWATQLGDLAGGKDSTFNPIFWHSTDGGATWGDPVELDLDSYAWIKDTLQSLWTDSLGNPASTGIATTAFDHDLTVDANGNVHMGVVIGSRGLGIDNAYTLSSGLAKFMADISTPDGGLTWTVRYLAPVLTLRAWVGGAVSGTPLAMDNFVQASRTDDGSHVFFTWLDSDTCSIGFGVSTNDAPDLLGASVRVSDGYQTQWKNWTRWDINYGGSVYYAHLAPTVLEDGGRHKLFTGFTGPAADELAPAAYTSLLHHTYFDETDYRDPASLSLGWTCIGVGSTASAVLQNLHLGAPAPNPSNLQTELTFSLPQSGQVEIHLRDLQGRTLRPLLLGEKNPGEHRLTLETHDLAPGIYLITLRSQGASATCKLVVTH